MKKAEGLSAKQFIRKCKITFAEYELPCKIISDAVTNFILDSSSYTHQSDDQAEVCIKFVKRTMKNA